MIVPPSWIIAGIASVAIVSYGWHCEAEKKEYRRFVAETAALGKQAAEMNRQVEVLRKSLTDRRDAEYEKSLAKYKRDVAALRLRDARARSGFLPPSTSSAQVPASIYCADRAGLESGLGRVVEGVRRRAREGFEELGKVQLELACARSWAADQAAVTPGGPGTESQDQSQKLKLGREKPPL